MAKDTASTGTRKAWTKPALTSASIKEITSGGTLTGTTDGGTPAVNMMMTSDRRLKRNVRQIGTSSSGLPIYSFQYVWGGPEFTGAMAQDVLEMRPSAVVLEETGFYSVDYSQIDVEMKLAA